MISMGFDPVWLAAFVKASCDAQGLAVKVTDPVVLARVGVLLRVTPAPGARTGRQPRARLALA